jgi:hypothetical protein
METTATDAKVDWADDTRVPQLDGAVGPDGGSTLIEPEFDVVVKPIDPNSPLYSIKSFEELGLLVFTFNRLC